MHRNHVPFFAALAVLRAAAQADGPTPTLSAATLDAGGGRSMSLHYTNDASLGGIFGLAASPAPVVTVRAGYAGQLYDLAALALTAADTALNEGDTLQLGVRLMLDDSSFLALPTGEVLWSVESGPLASVNTVGLATAGLVYKDTVATAQAAWGNFSAKLPLTVRNVATDDFGMYAADQIDDAWQVQYFGENNPLAAPLMDASGTGQTNLFKYQAGLDPLDPQSRFTLRIGGASTSSGVNLTFGPVVAGRSYVVTYKRVLTDATWTPLSLSVSSDDQGQRTVTDPNPDALQRFYRIEIIKQ